MEIGVKCGYYWEASVITENCKVKPESHKNVIKSWQFFGPSSGVSD